MLFVSILIASTSFADEYDFRKTKWGMSKEEVKLSENKERGYEEGDYFGYESEVAGMECLIGYIFTSIS